MSRAPELSPFESPETTAAPAAGVPPVGDVVQMKAAALPPPLVQLANPPADFEHRSQNARAGVVRRSRERLRKAGVAVDRWPAWLAPKAPQKAPKRRKRTRAPVQPAAYPPAQAPAQLPEQPAARPPGQAPHAGHPEHDPVAHVAGLGLGTLTAGASVAGAFVVLWDVTDKLYHGVAGMLRAGVPLEAELIAGLGVHLVAHSRMSAWLKAPLMAACLAVSALSVQAELTAADAVAPAAARARVALAMGAPLRECKVEVPPVSETAGPTAKRIGEETKAAALAAQRECMQAAQQEHAQGIENAKAVSPGEGDLPRLLSWLGAVGSIAFFPLLIAFITAARKHGRSGGAR